MPNRAYVPYEGTSWHPTPSLAPFRIHGANTAFSTGTTKGHAARQNRYAQESIMNVWCVCVYIGHVFPTRVCSYSHVYISRFRVYMTGRNVCR